MNPNRVSSWQIASNETAEVLFPGEFWNFYWEANCEESNRSLKQQLAFETCWAGGSSNPSSFVDVLNPENCWKRKRKNRICQKRRMRHKSSRRGYLFLSFPFLLPLTSFAVANESEIERKLMTWEHPTKKETRLVCLSCACCPIFHNSILFPRPFSSDNISATGVSAL